MTELQKMREIALIRANNNCEWPKCVNTKDPLEMAHVHGIGMGGSKTRKYDINNVAMLCRMHHRLYDGDTITYSTAEYRYLLQGYLSYKHEQSDY